MDLPQSDLAPDLREPGRPLVVRFGAVGDMILLTVLLEGLFEIYGKPCDVVAAGGAPRQVLAGLPSVGEVFTLNSRRAPYWLSPGQRRLVRWLRRRGPQPAWVVEDMDKVLWLLDRGGVPRGHVLSMQDLPRGDLEHVAHYLHRMLAERPVDFPADPGGTPPVPRPELLVTREEEADCRQWVERRGWTGRPLVLFQTQSRRRKRGRWPDERWAEVTGAVLARLPEARALLIGAPDEAAAVAELAAACGDPRVEPAAEDLPLRRLFALLRVAHSCVSLDTGPAHAASALGCPLVVLVGMADPRRNHPVPCGAPVRMVTSAGEDRWPPTRAEWEAWHDVAKITPAPVIAAWEEAARLGRSRSDVGYVYGTPNA